MESSVLSLPTRRRAAASAASVTVPWHLAAVVFAATSVIVGVIWDISWHMTIGRDTFWTPAHLAIYTGGAVAGLTSGFEVLRRSFFAGARAHDDVTVWRIFHGPLGGWLCIWGAVAMLTSAPFDDWWHNAYGLDVKIISPPHTVLALGFITILGGALLMAVAQQSREAGRSGIAPWVVAFTNGLALVDLAIFTTEYHDRTLMHSGVFYIASAIVFPFVLAAALRNTRLRYPATAAALFYTAIMCVQLWILPLFPGSPLLGPIRTPVTHMVPLDFPLLLLPAAVVLDLVFPRLASRNAWLQAAVLGVLFLAVHVATQWPFANFLMSDASRNALFRTDNFAYMLPPDWPKALGQFLPEATGTTLQKLGIALLVAVGSSRLGLACGGWLRAVKR